MAGLLSLRASYVDSALRFGATKHKLLTVYVNVNGVLQSHGTATTVFRATGGTELGSMKQAGVGHFQFWNGGVDEVNLYRRELSAAEVKTMAGI